VHFFDLPTFVAPIVTANVAGVFIRKAGDRVRVFLNKLASLPAQLVQENATVAGDNAGRLSDSLLVITTFGRRAMLTQDAFEL
jgi:hypothetical protein